jgi:hypothetical protein
VIDDERNAVALTTTINTVLGSKVAVAGAASRDAPCCSRLSAVAAACTLLQQVLYIGCRSRFLI